MPTLLFGVIGVQICVIWCFGREEKASVSLSTFRCSRRVFLVFHPVVSVKTLIGVSVTPISVLRYLAHCLCRRQARPSAYSWLQLARELERKSKRPGTPRHFDFVLCKKLCVNYLLIQILVLFRSLLSIRCLHIVLSTVLYLYL